MAGAVHQKIIRGIDRIICPELELLERMEILLNTAWAVVATVIVCHWLRVEGRDRADRRLQIVALAMLIVILFPVISVSDDLWAAQNPAETVGCQRRDHHASCPHSIFPAIASLPAPAVEELSFGILVCQAPRLSSLFTVFNPALDSIENRPPPAA